MKKRFVVYSVVLLVLALMAFSNFSGGESQGNRKHVWYWLMNIDGSRSKSEQARESFQSFGSNAVPYLVEVLEKKETYANKALIKVRPLLPGFIATQLPRPADWTDLRRNALRALAFLGPEAKEAVPAVCGVLRDPDAEVRQRAMEVLGVLGPGAKSAVPHLIELLKPDPVPGPPRWAIIHALGEIGRSAKDAIPILTAALHNQGEPFRANIPITLARIDTEGELVTPTLIELLSDKDIRVRQECAGALGTLGPKAKAAIPALRRALQDESALVRQSAVYALMQNEVVEAEAFVPLLIKNLKDQSMGPFRAATANLLGKIGLPAKAAIPFLVESLAETNDGIRFYAAQALWQIDRKPEILLPVLMPFLNDKRQSFCSRAAVVLGEFGSAAKVAIPYLMEAVRKYPDEIHSPRIFRILDEDKYPSFYAAQALWRIDRQADVVTPVLIEFLKAKESSFRIRAAKLLGEIGPAAQPAERALRTSLGDKDEKVRLEASEALRKIAIPAGEKINSN